MTPSVRYLPYAITTGADNMAADEALLFSAAQGIASLRFYGWDRATVSLGYFQTAAVRDSPSLSGLPWVRRPTGGAMLVHHHELTYALALPPGPSWQSQPWMPRMHGIIAAVLNDLGLTQPVGLARQEIKPAGQDLCFLHHTVSDLVWGGNKIGGSAQRKYRQALLQHGSILLRRSEYTPQLPGLLETAGLASAPEALADILAQQFAQETRWRLQESDWTISELAQREQLRLEKYTAEKWNAKR